MLKFDHSLRAAERTFLKIMNLLDIVILVGCIALSGLISHFFFILMGFSGWPLVAFTAIAAIVSGAIAKKLVSIMMHII